MPPLWAYEVANCLIALLRRKKISLEEYMVARAVINRLRPSVDDEGGGLTAAHIADLALDHGLTVYDAAYLEIAIRRHLELASRDSKLNRAACKCGVRLLLA